MKLRRPLCAVLPSAAQTAGGPVYLPFMFGAISADSCVNAPAGWLFGSGFEC